MGGRECERGWVGGETNRGNTAAGWCTAGSATSQATPGMPQGESFPLPRVAPLCHTPTPPTFAFHARRTLFHGMVSSNPSTCRRGGGGGGGQQWEGQGRRTPRWVGSGSGSRRCCMGRRMHKVRAFRAVAKPAPLPLHPLATPAPDCRPPPAACTAWPPCAAAPLAAAAPPARRARALPRRAPPQPPLAPPARAPRMGRRCRGAPRGAAAA